MNYFYEFLSYLLAVIFILASIGVVLAVYLAIKTYQYKKETIDGEEIKFQCKKDV